LRRRSGTVATEQHNRLFTVFGDRHVHVAAVEAYRLAVRADARAFPPCPWFAVGCPVCNKIALLALVYSGALTWFAPLQPLLAVTALALAGWALAVRLRGEISCPVPGAVARG